MISKMLRNTRHRACVYGIDGNIGRGRYCFDSVLGWLEHWLGEVLDGPMYLNIGGSLLYTYPRPRD